MEDSSKSGQDRSNIGQWRNDSHLKMQCLTLCTSITFRINPEVERLHLPRLLHPFLRFDCDPSEVIAAMPSSLNAY